MYLAIDPGKHGGVVFTNHKGRVQSLVKMPEKEADMVSLFNQAYIRGVLTVFIEKVPVYAGARQDKKGMRSSDAVKLYGNYMLCTGLALGFQFKVVHLTPIKWQNLVKCRNFTNLDTAQWKNKLKTHAKQLFPDENVTLWNADALLILKAGILLEKEN